MKEIQMNDQSQIPNPEVQQHFYMGVIELVYKNQEGKGVRLAMNTYISSNEMKISGEVISNLSEQAVVMGAQSHGIAPVQITSVTVLNIIYLGWMTPVEMFGAEAMEEATDADHEEATAGGTL